MASSNMFLYHVAFVNRGLDEIFTFKALVESKRQMTAEEMGCSLTPFGPRPRGKGSPKIFSHRNSAYILELELTLDAP